MKKNNSIMRSGLCAILGGLVLWIRVDWANNRNASLGCLFGRQHQMVLFVHQKLSRIVSGSCSGSVQIKGGQPNKK